MGSTRLTHPHGRSGKAGKATVTLENLGVPGAQHPVHFLDGLEPRPTRPISIGHGFQVRFEERLQDQQGSGLDHAIPDHANSEWPLPSSARLGNQHPLYCLRPVRLRSLGGVVRLTPISRPLARRDAPRTRVPSLPTSSVVWWIQTVLWTPPTPSTAPASKQE